jgi:hypothetical protein
MALSGLHAYIIILLKNKIPYKKWFFPSLLLGTIIPDVDFFFSQIHKLISIPSFLNILNKTFGHSFITIILIYIALMIIYEFKKSKKYLYIANGITLGIIFHIFLDFIISNNKIDLFWPLPIESISLYEQFMFSKNTIILLFTTEFIFLRLYTWKTINIILKNPLGNIDYIKPLTIWLKIQFYFTLSFLISSILIDIYYIYILFFLGYVPSLIIMIYILIITWNDLDYYKSETKNEEDSDYKERINLITIH